MAYEMYMGNILCPITPSKLQLKIKNQNKTMNLIDGTEINVLKEAGLTEVSYDLLLPNVEYPKSIATYKSGFVNAQYFLNEFEKMKVEKKSFIFKVIRTLPSGKALYNTEDLLVSLEDYTIKEDAKQGFDVVVSIKLKQYRHYGTKIIKVSSSDGTASVEETRETSNSPAPSKNSVVTHKVVEGDSLWNIAKTYYGDGSKYIAIYEANKDKIANPSLIYSGQVLTIPGVEQIPSLVANSAASNATSSSDSNSDSNQKCYLTINFAGYKFLYGKVRVNYVLNGKSGSIDFPNSARIQVDKRSLVEVCPITPSKNVTYKISSDKKYSWSNIVSWGVVVGEKAVINTDTVVQVTWESR